MASASEWREFFEDLGYSRKKIDRCMRNLVEHKLREQGYSMGGVERKMKENYGGIFGFNMRRRNIKYENRVFRSYEDFVEMSKNHSDLIKKIEEKNG